MCPPPPTATHEVLNQVPPLAGRNLFADHAALQRGARARGRRLGARAPAAAGAFWGGEPLRWGAQANETRRCCTPTTATATASTRSSSTPPGTR